MLLFHLLSKLYKRTGLVINKNLEFAEWANVFVDARMITELLNRLPHLCHIFEPGNDYRRFSSSRTAKTNIRALELAQVQVARANAEPVTDTRS